MAEAKNPIISAVLSFFIPGAGQIYNGETTKGAGILILYLLIWAVSAAGAVFTNGICCCGGGPVLLILWLVAIYDAYMGAQGKPLFKI